MNRSVPDIDSFNVRLSSLKSAIGRYDRSWDIPRLTGMWPNDLPAIEGVMVDAATAIAKTEAIIARLEQALRAEQHRRNTNHWTFDRPRLFQIGMALKAETQILAWQKSEQPLWEEQAA